jgi:hypothetical protein
MMVEGFGTKDFVRIAGVGARCVSRWTTFGKSTIFTNWALPRVLVIVGALFDHRLEGCVGKGMAAETKLLYYRVIFGEKSAKHEADLERGVDANAPHFESTECFREASFQSNDRFLFSLLDINEIEDVGERIDGARRVEVLIDVGNHLKTLSIKAMLLDK